MKYVKEEWQECEKCGFIPEPISSFISTSTGTGLHKMEFETGDLQSNSPDLMVFKCRRCKYEWWVEIE